MLRNPSSEQHAVVRFDRSVWLTSILSVTPPLFGTLLTLPRRPFCKRWVSRVASSSPMLAADSRTAAGLRAFGMSRAAELRFAGS